jgi:hypothetical protein
METDSPQSTGIGACQLSKVYRVAVWSNFFSEEAEHQCWTEPVPLGALGAKYGPEIALDDLLRLFSNPYALLAASRKSKLEGIVSKLLDRPYISGRSKD